MLVINRKTKKAIIAEIKPLTAKDFKNIKKDKQFSFDWEEEKKYEVFKLILKEENEIVGLIAIIDIPEELRLYIHLLEISKDNIGKNKKIERIAGCLIAYICRISFSKGYGGFVSLVPKTKLINHYQKEYGFAQFGRQLAVLGEISKNLTLKYL